jgi:hypothetical protein
MGEQGDMMSHYQYVHDYLTFAKWGFAKTAEGKRIRYDWTDSEGKDATSWRKEFLLALNNRINTKGNIVLPKNAIHNLSEYRRDGRYLKQWRETRTLAAPFYGGTRKFAMEKLNRRFPDVIEAWN